jgi:hypothetical protein
MDSSDNKTVLVNAFLEQYRIYRGETQSYLSYAVTSTTLFNAFLLAELAARFNFHYPLALALVPITTVAYLALLSLFYGYAMIAAHYSAFLEQKINQLLGATVFLFESEYVGPKLKRKDVSHIFFRSEYTPFGIIWTSISLLPLAITIYAFYGLYEGNTIPLWVQIVYIVVILVGVVAILGSLSQIIILRKKMNCDLLRKS